MRDKGEEEPSTAVIWVFLKKYSSISSSVVKKCLVYGTVSTVGQDCEGSVWAVLLFSLQFYLGIEGVS